MIYKAKNGSIYNIRTAKREDILQIIKVHNNSAQKAYEPFKHKYPELYASFSIPALHQSWNAFFDKYENDDNHIGIVVEKKFATADGKTHNRIIGVCKAGVLNEEYRHHMEEATGRKISDKDAAQIANLQTVYLDNNHQGLGLGRGVIGFFANYYSQRNRIRAITETLYDYEVSPRFFQKAGKASYLGYYYENSKAAVSNQHQTEGEIIPIKIWEMPDIQSLKITCYYKQQQQKFYRLPEKGFSKQPLAPLYQFRLQQGAQKHAI